MIIKEHQIETIIGQNNPFAGFLVYGPNEGLVRDQINKISKKYIEEDKYEIINIGNKEIEADFSLIDNSLKTISMFSKGKVVIIESLKDKNLPILEDIIIERPRNIILILKSENLSKLSKIRKYFELEERCYALPCYEEDIKSHINHIEKFIRENSIKLNPDIKNYLVQTLSNDRMINKHELEKIKIYYDDSQKEVVLDEIKYLLNDISSQSLNKMNRSVMYGKVNTSSLIIAKLLSEGSNPISLIRSMINYLTRIHKTKIEMKKGNSFDNSIKVLKPPVFWKDKDDFQKHCHKWPLQSIEKKLSELLETEILCKLNSKLAFINCEKSILLVAHKGKQYFRN